MSEPSAPPPWPDPDWEPTRPFFEGAAAGELRLPRCPGCDAFAWYPPEDGACRRCGRPGLAWTAVSGRGTLHSWAVVRRAFLPAFRDRVPYAAALVAVAEDPRVRLVTNVVDCPPEALRAGMALRAVFRTLSFEGLTAPPGRAGGVVVPLFVPV